MRCISTLLRLLRLKLQTGHGIAISKERKKERRKSNLQERVTIRVPLPQLSFPPSSPFCPQSGQKVAVPSDTLWNWTLSCGCKIFHFLPHFGRHISPVVILLLPSLLLLLRTAALLQLPPFRQLNKTICQRFSKRFCGKFDSSKRLQNAGYRAVNCEYFSRLSYESVTFARVALKALKLLSSSSVPGVARHRSLVWMDGWMDDFIHYTRHLI